MANLYREFNSIIALRKTSVKKVNEVFLFRCLIDAIKNVFLSSSNVYEKHQHRIEFCPTGCLFNRKCEISDLLIIFVKNNECRYTFMQNKFSNSSDQHSIKRVNMIQHNLLHNMLPFLPLTTGLLGTELSSAILKSGGSYGDFFIEKSSTMYNMRYFCASDLKTASSFPAKISATGKAPLRVVKIDKTVKGFPRRNLSGFNECFYTSNLDYFEFGASNMEIGTPIDFHNVALCKEIIPIILNASNENVDVLPNDLKDKLLTIMDKFDSEKKTQKTSKSLIPTIVINVGEKCYENTNREFYD